MRMQTQRMESISSSTHVNDRKSSLPTSWKPGRLVCATLAGRCECLRYCNDAACCLTAPISSAGCPLKGMASSEVAWYRVSQIVSLCRARGSDNRVQSAGALMLHSSNSRSVKCCALGLPSETARVIQPDFGAGEGNTSQCRMQKQHRELLETPVALPLPVRVKCDWDKLLAFDLATVRE